MGLHNGAVDTFNVSAIFGSLNDPTRFSTFFYNFSGQVWGPSWQTCCRRSRLCLLAVITGCYWPWLPIALVHPLHACSEASDCLADALLKRCRAQHSSSAPADKIPSSWGAPAAAAQVSGCAQGYGQQLAPGEEASLSYTVYLPPQLPPREFQV